MRPLFDLPTLAEGRPPTQLSIVVAAHRAAEHPGEAVCCAECAGKVKAALAG